MRNLISVCVFFASISNVRACVFCFVFFCSSSHSHLSVVLKAKHTHTHTIVKANAEIDFAIIFTTEMNEMWTHQYMSVHTDKLSFFSVTDLKQTDPLNLYSLLRSLKYK